MKASVQSKIKVIGIGGCGTGVLGYLLDQQNPYVTCVACHTDASSLHGSRVPEKLLLGRNVKLEQGTSANLERGRLAALDSQGEIAAILEGTDIVFILAGMGGGTGAGASHVIARLAKDMGILTIGVAVLPLRFEGKRQAKETEEGVRQLERYADAVLVVSHEQLHLHYGELPLKDAFAKVDELIGDTIKAVVEIATVPTEVNVDLDDVKTVLRQAGSMVMGTALAAGEGRAKRLIESALSMPLLQRRNISGAQKILLSITSGDKLDLEMEELTEIVEVIQNRGGDQAELIFGHGIDPALKDGLKLTFIATGFSEN